MKYVIFCISVFFLISSVYTQEDYNQCNNADTLCPQETVRVNNYNANITFCPSCEDDFTTCFTPLNTIWFVFRTNAMGGDVTVSGTNLLFDNTVNNTNNSLSIAVLETSVPCNSAGYVQLGCLTDQNGAFNLSVTGLAPDSEYYIVLTGTMVGAGAVDPSQFELDLRVAGPGVNRPASSIALIASNTIFCKGQTVNLSVDTTLCPEPASVNWYRNGVFWFTSVGTEIITAEIEDDDIIRAETACYEDCPIAVTSGDIQFTVLEFIIDAGQDLYIYAGESVQLDGYTDGANFYWEPAIWLSATDVLDPIAFPEQTTTFFLTATNGVCELTDEMVITVTSDLLIPDVFSPNGDGINDTWEIKGASRYPNMRIEVYDKWGQRVFESVSYNEEKFWDGTFNGKLLRTSTYYYVVSLNEQGPNDTVYKGAVTIVR